MKFREALKISSIPVIIASLCCLSPVILVLLSIGTVGFATSLADTLYGVYKWYFRLGGLIAFVIALIFYLRRSKGICTIDEVKKRRNEIINITAVSLIIAILGYLFFLYVVVHYIGVGLDIWKDYGKDNPQVLPVSVMEVTNIKVTNKALLADGCFWCVEADLEKVVGVVTVTSGYAGGSTENPTYEEYISAGHREVVEVIYDSSKVSYQNLVEHILKHGNPTDPSGSFYDRGLAYAPAIYYSNHLEKTSAEEVVAKITAKKILDTPITIAILPSVRFWPAEEYHQDYYKKNPLKYSYYRNGSGRDDFIKKYWGDNAGEFLYSIGPSSKSVSDIKPITSPDQFSPSRLQTYKKPSDANIRKLLTSIQYNVTQKEGTEKPFDNEYDRNSASGIYVDILSGEPLYSSKDKYDSGTGWPSFVQPITPNAVTLHVDKGIFTSRTEVRSRHADSHLGHVFDDGPQDRGGKRYCMNSAAMRFVPKQKMIEEGYSEYLKFVE